MHWRSIQVRFLLFKHFQCVKNIYFLLLRKWNSWDDYVNLISCFTCVQFQREIPLFCNGILVFKVATLCFTVPLLHFYTTNSSAIKAGFSHAFLERYTGLFKQHYGVCYSIWKIHERKLTSLISGFILIRCWHQKLNNISCFLLLGKTKAPNTIFTVQS